MSTPARAVERRPEDEGYLRIVEVRKEFDGFVAVDDVSLSIRKGEIFALLGGSGAWPASRSPPPARSSSTAS